MKMRLLQPQFFNEQHLGAGRVPAGAVIDVDDVTAARWRVLGIARKAKPGAETFQEARHAQLMEVLDEDDDELEGVYDAGVAREMAPAEIQAAQRRPRGRRPAAQVVAPESQDADESSDGDGDESHDGERE